jgi:hypothetical protein
VRRAIVLRNKTPGYLMRICAKGEGDEIKVNLRGGWKDGFVGLGEGMDMHES